MADSLIKLIRFDKGCKLKNNEKECFLTKAWDEVVVLKEVMRKFKVQFDKLSYCLSAT